MAVTQGFAARRIARNRKTDAAGQTMLFLQIGALRPITAAVLVADVEIIAALLIPPRLDLRQPSIL